MFHLKAIEIISKTLRGAVHSMAHCLGALYDTPHGVANAILLPAENAFADACCPGNPRDTSIEDLKLLYERLL